MVGDVTMAELLPALEAAFGDWRATARRAADQGPRRRHAAAERRLIVIDRPNSPQSVLLLARVLPLTGTQPGMEPLDLANEVIGNGFLSRLNMNLREDKGWTYGIRSALPAVAGPRSLTVYTPVQSDRTADSIRLILEDMAAVRERREGRRRDRAAARHRRQHPRPAQQLPDQQPGARRAARQPAARPPRRLPGEPAAIYRAIDAAEIDAAARQYLAPDDLAIIVVGDRKQIDAQLATLGMEIEYLSAEEL